VKLTQPQRDAMFALSCADGWMSSYTLRCGLNTLESLVNRGLVARKTGPGSIYSPQTCIKFKLTKNGVDWAEEHINKALREMA